MARWDSQARNLVLLTLVVKLLVAPRWARARRAQRPSSLPAEEQFEEAQFAYLGKASLLAEMMWRRPVTGIVQKAR